MNQLKNERRSNTAHLSDLGYGGFAIAVAVLLLWPIGTLIGSPIEGRWSTAAVATIVLLVAISRLTKWGDLATKPWSVRFGELLSRVWWVIVAQWFVINLRVFFAK